MIRNDGYGYMLFMEPKKEEKTEGIVDDLTLFMEKVMEKSISGTSGYSREGTNIRFSPEAGWRGTHDTDCGETSTNKDYLFKEAEIVTNSLAPFYVKYYRDTICHWDWLKIEHLIKHYNKGEVIDVSSYLENTKPAE